MPEQVSLFDSLQNREQISAGGGDVSGFSAHTYEDIISVENLLAAWREFLRGKRSKRDVQEFQHNLMDNVLALVCDSPDLLNTFER